MTLSVGHGIGGLATLTGVLGVTGGVFGLTGGAGFTGGLAGGTDGFTGAAGGLTGGFTGGLTGGTDGLVPGLEGGVITGFGLGFGTVGLAIAFLTINPCLLLRRILKAMIKSFFHYSILIDAIDLFIEPNFNFRLPQTITTSLGVLKLSQIQNINKALLQPSGRHVDNALHCQ
ncbi:MULTISPECIES: hypothetical protein [Pseudomonas]|uniref:hypothetical protein n=1 Tax=Pseudomonas TaxID=286 RepID=UPI001F22A569|nr:hypothetical protein [Pseudomonas sputi]